MSLFDLLTKGGAGAREESEFAFYIAKPVIAVLDDWQDPIIGFYEGREENLHVFDDYIRNEHVRIEPTSVRFFIFTEQRFQVLLKLDPFERACLLFPEQCLDTIFRKPKLIYVKNTTEINRLLRENDFWQDLREYRVEQRKHSIV